MVPRRINKYAQVYATDFSLAHAEPMATRSDTPKLLFILFARVSFISACIYDQRLVLSNAEGCHLKQLQPYTPWLNATKKDIKEIKKGTAHKLLQSRAPKLLWDDGLYLDAYKRSNITNDAYKLMEKPPR